MISHPSEVNDLGPIEENMSESESANENNQEEQKDESNADNFTEEEDEETKYKEGRYVLAKFFTSRGKQTYKYVCQIHKTDPLLVAGYKSSDNKKCFKRIPKDISEIDRCDIIAFLPKPVEKENLVEFPFDINTKEL